MSKRIKNIFGFGISLLLLAWLYFSIDWRIVGTQLLELNYWVVVPAVAILVVHFLLRALRWRYLLPQDSSPASLGLLFDCLMVGNFATYLLPLRAGEFIRPYFLTRHSGYGFLTAFASVIIERFFDLAVVLFTFAYVLYAVPSLPEWAGLGAIVLSGMAGAILVLIVVGSFLPGPVLAAQRKLTGLLPQRIKSKVDGFFTDFLASTAVLHSWRNLLSIVTLSILVWLACFMQFYIFLYLFPMEFTFLMAVTVGVIVALAVAAPSAPGFIGVYQTACIAGFEIFGYSRETAVTYSIITHLVNYLLFAVCAAIFFIRRDVSLTSFFKSGDKSYPGPPKDNPETL